MITKRVINVAMSMKFLRKRSDFLNTKDAILLPFILEVVVRPVQFTDFLIQIFRFLKISNRVIQYF